MRVVHAGPEHQKIVHPGGSQRGSRLMTAWRPGPRRHLQACFRQPGRALSVSGPSPEPDSCRTWRQTGFVKGRRSRSRVTPQAPLSGSGCR